MGTLKRFFIFHFILPFIICGFIFVHLFYLHFLSSNNPLGLNINNKIPFFPFIFIKDLFGLFLIFLFIILQTHFGIYTLSHPDNALEVSGLVTPLHIVPEWYFLCQYAMLKAVPNKNAGFIILLTSILIFFFFFIFLSFLSFFSLDRCSIPSREVSILCSYLDIRFFFFFFFFFLKKKKKKKKKKKSKKNNFSKIYKIFYKFLLKIRICILQFSFK